MKKLIVLVCSLSVILSFMVIPVSAASAEFVDKADSEFTKVHEKIGVWQFEDNVDVGKTLYSKGMGSKDLEISIVYKMDGNITAFKIDTLNLSGLGDSTLDVAVYVSPNGTTWTKIETSVTDQVMDDAYISPDIAYWFNSTVSNKNAIPSNITYLKISLMPFTRENMAGWSTVIDDVFITYDAQATPTPTKPAPTATVAPSSETPAPSPTDSVAESSEDSSVEISSDEDSSDIVSSTSEETSSDVETSAVSSEEDPSDSDSDSKSNTPIIIGAIVLGILAIAATTFFVLRKRKGTM